MLPKFIENNTNAKALLREYGITNPDKGLTKELYSLLKARLEKGEDEFSINSSDLIFEDGNFAFQNDTKDIDSEILDVLNEFIQTEETQEFLDLDADGELSDEEMQEFLGTIQTLDSNGENVSIYDVFSAMEYIDQGIFGTEEMLLANEQVLSDETPDEGDIALSGASKVNGSSKGGSRGGGSVSGSDSAPYQFQKEKKVTVEELEAKKNNEIMPALQKAQQDIQAIHSGENAQVKAAQEDCDAKKEAYEEALKNDENISDELKQQQQDNQGKIDAQKVAINDYKLQIYNKETAITQQESTVASDQSDVDAINRSISELNSQTPRDDEHKAVIDERLRAAKERLEQAKAKLEQDKQTLQTLKDEKVALEGELAAEEETLATLEQERQQIEQEILANCGEETKLAMDAFKTAEANIETVRATELEKAKGVEATAQADLNEINAQIDSLRAQEIEKEFAVFSLKNPEQLYDLMGLDEQNLNKEVFLKAIEGYNNLEDKGNGVLGIFDTTQGADANRYYLIDLNNFELLGRTAIKTGSGNMDDCIAANRHGSKATLSGFERVGGSYRSGKSWELGIRLDGLEPGINDNSRSKSTVGHYTTGNSTWGCKGITPVISGGRVDHEASKEKVKFFFPEGAILFTYPTDERYWEYSSLY